MDSTILVKSFDIEAGVKLIEALDKIRFPVKAAFWLFHEEAEEWRLHIATPVAGTLGPRAAYAKVLEELHRIEVKGNGRISVSVVDPSDKLVQLLSLSFRTDDGISGIGFSRNSINGVYIPAAYIYRMNP